MHRRQMQDFCNGLSDLLSDSARLAEARAELDAISAAIGDDVTALSLLERVSRMAKDAARYRKMRKNAILQDRNGPGLYLHLPRWDRGLPLGERLDNALDADR